MANSSKTVSAKKKSSKKSVGKKTATKKTTKKSTGKKRVSKNVPKTAIKKKSNKKVTLKVTPKKTVREKKRTQKKVARKPAPRKINKTQLFVRFVLSLIVFIPLSLLLASNILILNNTILVSPKVYASFHLTMITTSMIGMLIYRLYR